MRAEAGEVVGEGLARVRSDHAPDRVLARLYPDFGAGGFAPDAHVVIFYNRVNALVAPDSTVLDFGAGRGRFAEFQLGWKADLAALKGRCARLIGVDVDPVVLDNPMTHENRLIGPDGRLPLEDRSVDLILSWAVFEHVTDPETTAGELDRVLRPGGWICAWTPNKYGYVGLGARLVPNRLHARLLRRIGTDKRRDEDVFPVVYRMNTRRRLRSLFPPSRFEHHVAMRSGPPGYHGGNVHLARAIKTYDAVVPPALKSMLHIFMRKL